MKPSSIVMILSFALMSPSIPSLSSADENGAQTKKSQEVLPGYWEGTLNAGVLKLRMGLKFEKTKDGKLGGSMSSIDQGGKRLKIDEITIEAEKVVLRWTLLKASFVGVINKEGTKMTGQWKQSGVAFNLTFAKKKEPEAIVRPQEPKRPYPYVTKKAEFQNKKANINLVGELTLPKGDGPHAVAILLSGSGPQNKDGEVLTHKPLLVLSDHLTRKGIATLRWADRGIEGSEGSYFGSTAQELASDILAAISFLKQQKAIDSNNIGIIGHSEGGLLAPLVASQSKDVTFIVTLAGPALPGEEVLYLQGAALVKAMGGDETALKRQRQTQEMIFRIARNSKKFDEAKKEFEKEFAKFLEEFSKEEQEAAKKQEKSVLGQLGRVMTPWFRSFLDYDPRPTLKKVKCPVLALNGSLDLQVTPKDNLVALRKALGEDRNDVTIKELPNLNHMFQTAKTGLVSEYNQIEETMAPVALNMISDWIRERVRNRGQ
ncbi:MAG: alpha/beta hydrolase family protein [Gemmataceae bacterium]